MQICHPTFPYQSPNQRTSAFWLLKMLVIHQLNVRSEREQWKRLNQISINVTFAEWLLDQNVPSRCMSTVTKIHRATNALCATSRLVIALQFWSTSEYTLESDYMCVSFVKQHSLSLEILDATNALGKLSLSCKETSSTVYSYDDRFSCIVRSTINLQAVHFPGFYCRLHYWHQFVSLVYILTVTIL